MKDLQPTLQEPFYFNNVPNLKKCVTSLACKFIYSVKTVEIDEKQIHSIYYTCILLRQNQQWQQLNGVA